MRYLNRTFIILAGLVMTGQVFAQDLNQVLILSGGEFEQSGPPYQDRGSVAFYDPANDTYEFKDSIYVESVQDAVIHEDYAYLAAEDSLIQYDLNAYQRNETQVFSNNQFLSLNNDLLLSGNFNGFFNPNPDFPIVQGWNLPAFDSTLTIANDSLYEGPGDALVHNDKIYVSHNISKTTAFRDSLGFLAVYNQNTGQVEKNYRLDSTGAGIGELFFYNNKIYGDFGRKSQLMELDLSNETISYINFRLNLPVGVFNDKLYGYTTSNEVQSYDLSTNQYNGVQFPILNSAQVNAFNYDTLNNKFYVAQTNFADTGFLTIYNEDGTPDTSFPTNVSPNSIVFDYEAGSSSRETLTEAENINTNVFPNPAGNQISLQVQEAIQGQVQITIHDVNGKQMIRETQNGVTSNETFEWSLDSWKSGTYFIEMTTGDQTMTEKFVKQ